MQMGLNYNNINKNNNFTMLEDTICLVIRTTQVIFILSLYFIIKIKKKIAILRKKEIDLTCDS